MAFVNRAVTLFAPWTRPSESSLTITIAATATARSQLAAFDRALVAVGAENRNLIRLSSVIPPASTIVRARTSDDGEWGDRRYVVYAEQRTSDPGVEAEDEVRSLMSDSLAELQISRGIDLGSPCMVITGIRCVDDPVCALVLAAFGSESWHGVSWTPWS